MQLDKKLSVYSVSAFTETQFSQITPMNKDYDALGTVICVHGAICGQTLSHFGDSNSRPVVYETTALTD
jgi:hypothetical protein